MVSSSRSRHANPEAPSRRTLARTRTQVVPCALVDSRSRPVCRRRATKLEALVKAGFPGAKITINEEKPRKGCFEVTVNGDVTLSLLDMPRPFPKLKALDMDEVAADVVKALS